MDEIEDLKQVIEVRDRVLKPEGIFVRFLYQELLYVRFT